MKEKISNTPHCHKGKSSESLLDKELILRELDILPGQVILDAGCGNGYMAKEFSRLLNGSGKVYALDTDQEAIEILKEETEEANIEPFTADMTKEVLIESASLDLIYMSTVFHGFAKEQIPCVQKELKRLLKPKGTLAILEIKKEDTPFGPSLDIRYSPEELKQAVKLTPKATVEVGSYFYMQLFENNLV